MKVLAVLAVAASLALQVTARSAQVERVTSALQGSFAGLSAKRNHWFENYSSLKQITEADSLQLAELLVVSRMAIPMIWHLYSNSVKAQKASLPRLVEAGAQSLPYHTTFPAPLLASVIHLEATLLLHQHRNFQVEILKDLEQIFFLTFNFDEKRAVVGHRDRTLQYLERVVLADQDFPQITLHQPFRVNVQVADDCVFASIWLANLNLEVPMPLPAKHHWCTKDYSVPVNYSINIIPLGHRGSLAASQEDMQSEEVSQEDLQSQEVSQEEQEAGYEADNTKLVAAVVYAGVILQ